MDNFIIEPLIRFLQNLPIEFTSLILFWCCVSSILLLFKIFGKNGLYIHSIVAIISANIQVLKMVKFNFHQFPVALGTVVFASTYLCSGILTEHYGPQAAESNVWFCFSAQILMTLFMIITIGHRPLPYNIITPENIQALNAEQAISIIFTPLPRLLISSLIAFISAQKLGIWLFNLTKKLTNTKYLWFRTMFLVGFSTIVDTLIFNLLAWKFLNNHLHSFKYIWNTYIISTLITQGVITILSSPIIDLSYRFKPRN